MNKKFFILFLGKPGINHLAAVKAIITEEKDLVGYSYIDYDTDFNSFLLTFSKEVDELNNRNIEPIIMKGENIHTEDYIRPLIKYYKQKHPEDKFFISHCACFADFILTDGALLTKYTKENIEAVIKNAVTLRDQLNYNSKTISMLNAGGDTNPNTAPAGWLDIYNDLPKETENYFLEMIQLDVALSSTIRVNKLKSDEVNLPAIIIPSSINEANSIWKTLTTVANKTLAGIVVGIPMYIGLTSRTDQYDSIYQTLYTLIKLLKQNTQKEKIYDRSNIK